MVQVRNIPVTSGLASLRSITIELTGNAAPGELVALKAKSVTGASGPVQRFVRAHDCELSETHAPIR